VRPAAAWLLGPFELDRARIELEDRGLCRGEDVNADDWFPDGVERPRAAGGRRSARAQARKQCEGCPVMSTCLLVALTNDERHGIWAGRPGWELADIRQGIRAAEYALESYRKAATARAETAVAELAVVDLVDSEVVDDQLRELLVERFGALEGAA
jgi:hypothetical protein